MRLIDADALKEFIDDCRICDICLQEAPRCSYDCDFPDFLTGKWEMAIDAQPTIDAVEVVRCKDCRWYDKGENEVSTWSICTRLMGIRDSVIDTDYCSFADRRQESEVE